MGAWGPGTFEDDIASDWIEDLNDSDPIAFFRECLNLPATGPLDYVACIGVTCTSHIIAALLDGDRNQIPDQGQSWFDANDSLDVQSLVLCCLEGLRRVTDEESDLRIVWEDSDDFQSWLANLQRINHRLVLEV